MFELQKKERGKHFLEGFLRRRGKSPSFQAHNVLSFVRRGDDSLSPLIARGMEAKKNPTILSLNVEPIRDSVHKASLR